MRGNQIKIMLCGLVVLLLTGRFSTRATAAVWQWSAPITSVTSTETKSHPRAYLYIPPTTRRVRAVVVGQHNMLEEGILEHPIFRKALADTDMAAVWVTPAFDGVFRGDQGAGDHFQNMMTALANESGYTELAFAPAIPIGHSAMASYPYHFAVWNPTRTAAAISIKGTWPDYKDANSPPRKDGDLDGVPLLYINGEYEDAQGRAAKAASFRARNPMSPLTMWVDAGGGHFDTHDRIIDAIAVYLRKLAHYRLPTDAPPDGPVTLKPIDPTATGALYDRWRKTERPKAPPAPVGQYAGDATEAFWAFDEDLAKTIEAYNADALGKKVAVVGYVQNGEVLPQNPKAHQQVTLKFLPVEDGMTLKLTARFLDTVPEGRPVGWTGLPKDSPVGHPSGGGPIVIDKITGPIVKTAPDTFKIRFNRLGFDNPKRSNDVWMMATHPGDGEYRRVVQQASMRFPLKNDKGTPQTITFRPIADQKAGAAATLKLNATSDANVPVYYYVREGPAEVSDDGTLTFTPIPPRAKFPMKVTVVAWQWGRSIEPFLRSAEPVKHTFSILGPDGQDEAQPASGSTAGGR